MTWTEIGIEQARPRLGDIANAVYYGDDPVYLTRSGRRIAVLRGVPSDDPAELARDVLAYGDDNGSETKLHLINPILAGLHLALDVMSKAEQDQRLAAATDDAEWFDGLIGDLSTPLSPQMQAVSDRYMRAVRRIAGEDTDGIEEI